MVVADSGKSHSWERRVTGGGLMRTRMLAYDGASTHKILIKYKGKMYTLYQRYQADTKVTRSRSISL